jgi:hypothetical protein
LKRATLAVLPGGNLILKNWVSEWIGLKGGFVNVKLCKSILRIIGK